MRNNLGYTLNDGQERAYTEIMESIKARRHHLVTGDAGSGKTVLMQVIAATLHEGWSPVAISAPTHQACGVARKKLRAGNVDAPVCTLQTLLGLTPKPRGDKLVFTRNPRAESINADIVFVDECFVGSTLVDTPDGPTRIDQIFPGDQILNATGCDVAIAVSRKEAKSVVQIIIGDKTITSSRSHRFFTARGLVRAECLGPGDELVSVPEAVRRLRNGVRPAEELDGSLLLTALLDALVAKATDVSRQDLHPKQCGESGSRQKGVAEFGQPEGKSRDRSYQSVNPGNQSRGSSQNQFPPQGDRPSAPDQRGKWQTSTCAAGAIAQRTWSGVDHGICGEDKEAIGGSTSSLQNRYSQSSIDDCDRGGRLLAWCNLTETARSEKGCVPGFCRVDCVEVLQSGDPRLDHERDADGKLYLWDIQAASHSSFGVSGYLVHNCSMVGTDLYQHIERWLDGRAVIFFGDEGQLFPVGEGRSPTFDTEHHSHLSKPERQSQDNPVLATAWAIRKCQAEGPNWDWIKPAHSGPYGVFVPADPDVWMRKAFTSDEFNADSLSFRLLCWTNKTVARTNAKIREWRYGRTNTPFVVGEHALIRETLVERRKIILNTNEEVIVREIDKDSKDGLPTWRMTVETEDRHKVEVHMPADDQAYHAKLTALADTARRNGQWGRFHGFKQSFVTAQAPYALTTHNCQGLTLKNAFIDIPEMRRWVNSNQGEGLRGLYVDATRPTHGMFCV